ncbi:amidohydrolase family protein [Roseomonas sp. NAR14]|uniref:Amidohydrolase family protein n=1 Tax=Roseomonas acroporae TaxID=2937791 RepID=A0A9X1YBH9_9PROT|nr:amidohydrolase family protein [Roseomonas acroporae]MCK8787056.1 amidohydrolase family protein [Roseomonas acroporae]
MATAPHAGPHLQVRPDWLARRREAPLEPDLPIIDPHHHLWDRPGSRYLLEDLLADTGSGHDVRATVYVQARAMLRADGPVEERSLGETEFANGVAACSASGVYGPTRACAGIVGMVDLMLGEAAGPLLERHQRVAGERLRGIRNTTAWHESPEILSNPIPPPPGMLTSAGFRQGAALLPGFGLSLDIWAYHTQLDDVLALARSLPALQLVLNHCGGPLGAGPYAGRRAEVLAEWRDRMARLAELPNVAVKLGGLGMAVNGFGFEKGETPPGSEELAAAFAPYILGCIELFGPERCMFESNFPVDKGSYGYTVLWNAFKRLTAGMAQGERTALFAGTAARIYRLPLGPAA